MLKKTTNQTNKNSHGTGHRHVATHHLLTTLYFIEPYSCAQILPVCLLPDIHRPFQFQKITLYTSHHILVLKGQCK